MDEAKQEDDNMNETKQEDLKSERVSDVKNAHCRQGRLNA